MKFLDHITKLQKLYMENAKSVTSWENNNF